jgi:hypothetical protein
MLPIRKFIFNRIRYAVSFLSCFNLKRNWEIKHLELLSRVMLERAAINLQPFRMICVTAFLCSRRSSVSIAYDYRLDDKGSIPGRGKGLPSSLCVRTSSEVHLASYPMDTGGLFPGVNPGRSVTLTTHPHLVPRKRISTIYILYPLAPAWFSGTALLFTFYRLSSVPAFVSRWTDGILLESC